MTIGSLDATSAYGRAIQVASGLQSSTPTGSSADAGTDASSFGAMVQNMVGETAGALHTAEAQSARQVAGQGDMIDVVTAIGAAETALDTVVAVRDKVVGAYTEIMQMQV